MLGKSPKLIGKVKSQLDKLDDISIENDGSVTHKILRVRKVYSKKALKDFKKQGITPKSHGALRKWPSFSSFKSWRTKYLNN